MQMMVLPALLVMLLFIYFPFFQGIIISFREWNGYSPHFKWVGPAKYIRLFSDRHFLRVMTNTLIYGLGSTFLQNIMGLALALYFNRETPGNRVMRTIIYLPAIISPLIMGYVWRFLFRFDGGALNDLTGLFGFAAIDWLADGDRAVWIITLVNSFQYVGVSMVLYLAGLKTIGREFYEAAEIDGAGRGRRFLSITLPFLINSITVSLVINIIGGLKLFDIIYSLTGGGPGYQSASISTMTREVFFVRQDAGYAAAMGNVMFLMILVITLAVLQYLRKKEVEL